MIRLKFYAIILFILLHAALIYPEPLVKPPDTRNTQVLYISHLFIPAEGGTNLEAGYNDLSVNVIESNTIIDRYQYTMKGKQGEIDLETTSVLINYIYKINNCTEIKAVLPFYYHHGGFMDHYIESFHKAFPGDGLENGGREYSGDNEIHIRYQPAAGGPDIRNSFYGIGDPSFFFKRNLVEGNPGIISVIGIKPETGEKAFINSGTTDLGISFTADYRKSIFYIYIMAGYTRFFGNGIYSRELDQYRNYLLSAAAGTGILFFDTFYLSTQFYIHNSLYKTGVKRIDNPTVINTYSLRWGANKQTVIQFSIEEDPFTYAASDIVFSLRAEYTF